MKCRDCGATESTSWTNDRCSPCHSQYRNKGRNRLNDRLRRFVSSMKGVGCCKCGESDHACLDYHHVDAGNKEFSVGNRVTSRGFQTLLEEISKCAVVCSNCHRRHHYYGNSMTFDLPDRDEVWRRLLLAQEAGAVSQEEAINLLGTLFGVP